MTIDENINKKYNIIVKLSSDYYHAYVTVDADEYDFVLTKETILDALKSKNVTFGINPNAIEEIVKHPENAERVEVATGIYHKHGKDSVIKYEIEMNADLKPKKNEDGTVDYKNINYTQAITKGQVLATKSPITLGESGTTVTGMSIKARDGKLANFSFGKNVMQSEDEMSLISECDGTLETQGNKISIIEVLEIFTDVGIKTGNISFTGKVIIRGNITSGFKVETQDSIEVIGVVESAELSAGGDILINGGVQGNDDCTIKAGGNIKGIYFNNCKIIAGGSIQTDSMMHCDVVTDNSIEAKGKKGLIMGGTYVARHHIVGKVIGAEIGTITKLQLGITNDIMIEFQDLASSIKEYKSNITKLNKALEILKKQKLVRPDDKKVLALYNSSQSTLIEYKEKLKKAMFNFKKINDLMEKLRDVYVQADIMHPGVRLKIGNSHYNVKEDLNKIKITKDQGEIVLKTF